MLNPVTFGTTVHLKRENFILDKNDLPGAMLYTSIKNDLAEAKTKAFLDKKDGLHLHFNRTKKGHNNRIEVSVVDDKNYGRTKTFDDISIMASTWVDPIVQLITKFREAAKTPPKK